MNKDNEDKKENKDYIINIRVSRQTYEKIKDKARENRESMSNLVRKMVDDSSEIISDLSNELLGRNKESKFKDVIGYHKIVAAQELKCDGCGAVIAVGETTTVGETAGVKKYFFCHNCK